MHKRNKDSFDDIELASSSLVPFFNHSKYSGHLSLPLPFFLQTSFYLLFLSLAKLTTAFTFFIHFLCLSYIIEFSRFTSNHSSKTIIFFSSSFPPPIRFLFYTPGYLFYPKTSVEHLIISMKLIQSSSAVFVYLWLTQLNKTSTPKK